MKVIDGNHHVVISGGLVRKTPRKDRRTYQGFVQECHVYRHFNPQGVTVDGDCISMPEWGSPGEFSPVVLPDVLYAITEVKEGMRDYPHNLLSYRDSNARGVGNIGDIPLLEWYWGILHKYREPEVEVSHGDVRVENWVMLPNGGVRLVDFESVCLAPKLWDTTCLARSVFSYDPSMFAEISGQVPVSHKSAWVRCAMEALRAYREGGVEKYLSSCSESDEFLRTIGAGKFLYPTNPVG